MTTRTGTDRADLTRPGTTGRWPVMERSVLATVLGVPPVAAVALAGVFTGLGVFIDLASIGTLGFVFKACYFTGCLLAVAWVRRRSLFAPMVQPPLLLAVAVPTVVLLGGGIPAGAGFAEAMLVIVGPLVNGFPSMALTTAVTAAVGAARIVVQRDPRQMSAPSAKSAASRRKATSPKRPARPGTAAVGERAQRR